MKIDDLLGGAERGSPVKNLAAAFGVSPAQTEAAVRQMTAALAVRIERNTLSRGGLADTIDLLGGIPAVRADDDPQNLPAPETIDNGNKVLDQLLGSKHLSRGIAARAAKASGIAPATLEKMLPVVASLLAGSLQQQTQDVFAKRLGSMPGLEMFGQTALRGSPLPLPLPGEPPIAPDQTRSPRLDLPKPAGSSGGGMGGGVSGRSPLPLPGDNFPRRQNPYEDLGKVIRQGGATAPDGGPLGGLVRSILGSVLGFGNRTILGSLFQLFLIRFLPVILRRILSR